MIKFPEYILETAANGIKIYAIPRLEFPILNITALWPQGTLVDPLSKEGLTQAYVFLLRRGNSKYAPQRQDEFLDFHGISLQTYAHHQQFVIDFEGLSDKNKIMRELLDLTVNNTHFSGEEFDKYIPRRIEGLLKSKENPGFLTNRAGAMALFGNRYFGRPSNGTPDSLQNMSLSDCIEYKKRIVTAPVLYLAGKITDEDIDGLKMMASRIKINLQSEPQDFKPESGHTGSKIWIIDKPEAQQTHVRFQWLAPQFHEAHFIPFQLGNLILGGSYNSRLMQHIRVKKGLTYNISSRLQALNKFTSVFSINSFTRPDQVDELLAGIQEEIQNIRTTNPSEDELIRNCNFIAGQYPLSFETNNDLINHLAQMELLDSNVERMENLPELFRACSPSEITSAFSHFVKEDNMNLVLTGPADLILKGNPNLSSQNVTIKSIDDILYNR